MKKVKTIIPGYDEIKTEEDIVNHRNHLVFNDGNYPASIPDCYVVGMNGNCGRGCPVYLRGECENEKEMLTDHK